MNILLYSKKWRWSIGISKLVYLFFLSLFVSGLQKVYGQQEITNAVPFARIGCPSSTLVGSATTFTFCYDNRGTESSYLPYLEVFLPRDCFDPETNTRDSLSGVSSLSGRIIKISDIISFDEGALVCSDDPVLTPPMTNIPLTCTSPLPSDKKVYEVCAPGNYVMGVYFLEVTTFSPSLPELCIDVSIITGNSGGSCENKPIYLRAIDRFTQAVGSPLTLITVPDTNQCPTSPPLLDQITSVNSQDITAAPSEAQCIVSSQPWLAQWNETGGPYVIGDGSGGNYSFGWSISTGNNISLSGVVGEIQIPPCWFMTGFEFYCTGIEGCENFICNGNEFLSSPRCPSTLPSEHVQLQFFDRTPASHGVDRVVIFFGFIPENSRKNLQIQVRPNCPGDYCPASNAVNGNTSCNPNDYLWTGNFTASCLSNATYQCPNFDNPFEPNWNGSINLDPGNLKPVMTNIAIRIETTSLTTSELCYKETPACSDEDLNMYPVLINTNIALGLVPKQDTIIVTTKNGTLMDLSTITDRDILKIQQNSLTKKYSMFLNYTKLSGLMECPAEINFCNDVLPTNPLTGELTYGCQEFLSRVNITSNFYVPSTGRQLNTDVGKAYDSVFDTITPSSTVNTAHGVIAVSSGTDASTIQSCANIETQRIPGFGFCEKQDVEISPGTLVTYRQQSRLNLVVAPFGIETDLFLPTPFLSSPQSSPRMINYQSHPPTGSNSAIGTAYYPPAGFCYWGPTDTYHQKQIGNSTYYYDIVNGAIKFQLGSIDLHSANDTHAIIDLLCTTTVNDVLVGNQNSEIELSSLWTYSLIGAENSTCYTKTSFYSFNEGLARLNVAKFIIQAAPLDRNPISGPTTEFSFSQGSNTSQLCSSTECFGTTAVGREGFRLRKPVNLPYVATSSSETGVGAQFISNLSPVNSTVTYGIIVWNSGVSEAFDIVVIDEIPIDGIVQDVSNIYASKTYDSIEDYTEFVKLTTNSTHVTLIFNSTGSNVDLEGTFSGLSAATPARERSILITFDVLYSSECRSTASNLAQLIGYANTPSGINQIENSPVQTFTTGINFNENTVIIEESNIVQNGLSSYKIHVGEVYNVTVCTVWTETVKNPFIEIPIDNYQGNYQLVMDSNIVNNYPTVDAQGWTKSIDTSNSCTKIRLNGYTPTECIILSYNGNINMNTLSDNTGVGIGASNGLCVEMTIMGPGDSLDRENINFDITGPKFHLPLSNNFERNCISITSAGSFRTFAFNPKGYLNTDCTNKECKDPLTPFNVSMDFTSETFNGYNSATGEYSFRQATIINPICVIRLDRRRIDSYTPLPSPTGWSLSSETTTGENTDLIYTMTVPNSRTYGKYINSLYKSEFRLTIVPRPILNNQDQLLPEDTVEFSCTGDSIEEQQTFNFLTNSVTKNTLPDVERIRNINSFINNTNIATVGATCNMCIIPNPEFWIFNMSDIETSWDCDTDALHSTVCYSLTVNCTVNPTLGNTACQGIREYQIALPESLTAWPSDAKITYPDKTTPWNSQATGISIIPTISTPDNYLSLKNALNPGADFINGTLKLNYPNPNPLEFCLIFSQELSKGNGQNNTGYINSNTQEICPCPGSSESESILTISDSSVILPIADPTFGSLPTCWVITDPPYPNATYDPPIDYNITFKFATLDFSSYIQAVTCTVNISDPNPEFTFDVSAIQLDPTCATILGDTTDTEIKVGFTCNDTLSIPTTILTASPTTYESEVDILCQSTTFPDSNGTICNSTSGTTIPPIPACPTPSPTPLPTPSPTPSPTPFPTPSPTPFPTPFPTHESPICMFLNFTFCGTEIDVNLLLIGQGSEEFYGYLFLPNGTVLIGDVPLSTDDCCNVTIIPTNCTFECNPRDCPWKDPRLLSSIDTTGRVHLHNTNLLPDINDSNKGIEKNNKVQGGFNFVHMSKLTSHHRLLQITPCLLCNRWPWIPGIVIPPSVGVSVGVPVGLLFLKHKGRNMTHFNHLVEKQYGKKGEEEETSMKLMQASTMTEERIDAMNSLLLAFSNYEKEDFEDDTKDQTLYSKEVNILDEEPEEDTYTLVFSRLKVNGYYTSSKYRTKKLNRDAKSIPTNSDKDTNTLESKEAKVEQISEQSPSERSRRIIKVLQHATVYEHGYNKLTLINNENNQNLGEFEILSP